MKRLEEYQELIERDAVEISNFWKYVQIFLYFSCTASGYICSVLFYILWQHCFGGDCLLWAKFVLMSEIKPDSSGIFNIHTVKSNYTSWWKHVITDSEVVYKCEIYLITCFSSCIFGIVWSTFFLMCGKGGYNIAIYEGPWRIVLPAISFNFFFALMSIYANHNLQEGFVEFNTNIKNIFFEIYNSSIVLNECKIIQTYVEIYNFHDHDVCNIFLWQQVFSDIMMWSWIGGLVLLLLRVITVTDFKILKITIYKLPSSNTSDNANKNKTKKNNVQGNKTE